jgi:hypothetical protein
MSRSTPRARRESSDWFQILALTGIAVGILIVIAGFVVWFLTNRESSLIVGAGLALASGGGLRQLGEKYLSQAPQYQSPPAHLPEPQSSSTPSQVQGEED